MAVPGRILLVGPEAAAGGLHAILVDGPWECLRADTTDGVLLRLRQAPDIDVVVLAPDGALSPHIDLCRQIKFDARTAFVAVVFGLRTYQGSDPGAVFAAGADDCIHLPAPAAEIRLRVGNAYHAKRATDSLEDARAVIASLANAIEGRDAYTRGHVERVATYAVELGRRLGVPIDQLSALRVGGIVHDIGKVAIPDHILNKPGRLTPDELAIVRLHPQIGHDILQPSRTFRHVLPIVRSHHERLNGTGYPDGLRDDEVPLLARITAVADVFDALSTARSYRPAFAAPDYRAILADEASRGNLDADIVATLLSMLDESPLAIAAAHPALALPGPHSSN